MNAEFTFDSIDIHSGVSANAIIVQKERVRSLLKPRFKVKLLYPFCEFVLGQIIAPLSNVKIEGYRAHPKIFQELKWWEHRLPEDMPEHIKSARMGMVVILKTKTVIGAMEVTLEDHTGSVASMPITDFMPATEQEYNFYKEKQGRLN